MNDELLEMTFEPWRWEQAIDHGIVKDIPIPLLRQLCSPQVRAALYTQIKNGTYIISAPHTAQIPKDDGTYRTVYVNEAVDRILLFIINSCLFELGRDMIHPSCMSYQKRISCGDAVLSISRKIAQSDGIVGWKSDYSKYFDNVKIESIDASFDEFENRHGKSAIIDLLRSYYHDDNYIEYNKETKEWEAKKKFQSLKQGCAVASWLANVVMYEQDERLSKMAYAYCRYCDDTYYIGDNYAEAVEVMKSIAEKHGVTINPKKMEYIDKYHWYKFLGFSIKGDEISFSKNSIYRLVEQIKHDTLKNKNCDTAEKAMKAIYRRLYKGPKKNSYAWAKRTLRYVNQHHDLLVLDNYLKDIIRACALNRRHIGGLGYRKEQSIGTLHRGTGQNVRSNRERMPHIDGWIPITEMANAIHASNDAYETLVRTLM